MRGKINKTVLLLLLLSFSWSLAAGERVLVDLDTAILAALENDLSFRIAVINYEKNRLEQEKREANYLLQASRYNELEMEMSRISLENNYRNTVNNLAIARDDYQQRIKEFSRQLDPLEGELELAGLTYREKWPLSEAEALEIALANSTELELARLELVLAEIDQERAGISAAELDKKIKEKALEVARLELEKRKEEFLDKVRDAYYQYQQAHKRIQLNEERLQGAEERYRIREKQYAAGLISKIEVMEYELNLLQARYNYYSSIANLYQAEEGLRQILNRGVSK